MKPVQYTGSSDAESRERGFGSGIHVKSLCFEIDRAVIGKIDRSVRSWPDWIEYSRIVTNNVDPENRVLYRFDGSSGIIGYY